MNKNCLQLYEKVFTNVHKLLRVDRRPIVVTPEGLTSSGFLWQRAFLSFTVEERLFKSNRCRELAHNVQCTLFTTSPRCFGGKSCMKWTKQLFNEVISLIVPVLSFLLCLVLLRRKAVGEMLMDLCSEFGPRRAKEIQMFEPEACRWWCHFYDIIKRVSCH